MWHTITALFKTILLLTCLILLTLTRSGFTSCRKSQVSFWYLGPPLCLCKHKNHIEKAMCLTAMACPRQDPATGVWWNRKIGTWFFVKQVPAKRASKNQAAGSLETKSVSIGQKETEDMILDNLFPAILGKWPAWEQRRVRIQLDNALPHPKPGKLGKRVADRLVEYSTAGWYIEISMQPANSPDLNSLDLAFF
jgi:hypothetical protein